jgi:hypothetical protein
MLLATVLTSFVVAVAIATSVYLARARRDCARPELTARRGVSSAASTGQDGDAADDGGSLTGSGIIPPTFGASPEGVVTPPEGVLAPSDYVPLASAEGVPLLVRLATMVIDNDRAILALVPAGGCWAELRERPPATWGTLCVELTSHGPSAPVLERWRDERTVLCLTADGKCAVHLSGANQDVWLALT